jgi:hypothetical protein
MLRVGDGLWGTASSTSLQPLKSADPERGEAVCPVSGGATPTKAGGSKSTSGQKTMTREVA